MYARTSHILLVGALTLSATLTTPRGAHAETSTAETDQARELTFKGNEHFRKKKWDKAYAAYSGAWALKKHYSIAGNLADVEIILGKHREAAEHLTFVLAGLPAGRDKDRKRSEQQLADVKQHIATVSVSVSVSGAEVFVDGKSVGNAPLAGDVFLDPGEHKVEARLDGYVAASETVSASAGKSASVALVLERESAAPVLAPAPGAPHSGGAAPQADAGAKANSDGMSTRTAVLITGAGLTVASAAVAVGFMLKANGHQSDADAFLSDAKKQSGASSPCLGAGSSSSLCQQLADAQDARNSANTVEGVAWGFAGGFAVATVVTYLVWPTGGKQQSNRSAVWRIAPTIGSTQRGVNVAGHF